jgi:hypothetical protein
MPELIRETSIYFMAGTMTIRIPADITKKMGITPDMKRAGIRTPDSHTIELVIGVK